MRVNISYYELVRNDGGLIYTDNAKNTLGEGVSAYVLKSLCTTIIHRNRVNILTETEFLALKIVEKISELTVLVFIVYGPPRSQDLYKVLDFLVSKA